MKKNWKVKLITMLMVFVLTMVNILPTQNAVYATRSGGYVDDNLVTQESSSLWEKALTAFLVAGTLGLYGLISIAAGQNDEGGPVTIESLFFNNYNKTSLNIFSDMPVPSGETYKMNTYVSEMGIGESLNDFYRFFTKLAIVAYILMMIYIGIRILLNAGTEKNAKYKEFILYWVQGIILLFLFPYVIKYTIAINNAFVAFIADNKKNIGALGAMIEQPGVKANGSMGMSDIESAMGSAQNSLDAGSDYMSMMFRMATKQGWLVYGICWIIMVKQLLSLLIIYFKRLLMTIFLIAVFPLVMISYAIDKLADGKSQAFGNWCKEFLLNVFIQSFHAIVYVLCMALILKLGTTADSIRKNWLLIVIVVTFISKGDDMLRAIFHMNGGGGDTVKGVASTALQAHAAVKLAGGAKNATAKMFGKDSHVGHVAQGIGNLQSHMRQAQISRLDESNAQLDQTIEEQAPVHQMADLNAPQTLADSARIALDENATEEERNAALDNLIAAHNMPEGEEKEKALNELAEQFKGREGELDELYSMMEVRAAANAMMVGGLQPVEFNEKIEILLEKMKGTGMAAAMASSVLKNPRNLNKIKMAGAVKFKRPEQTTSVIYNLKGRRYNHTTGKVGGASVAVAGGTKKTGGTRKAGDRYSGVFRTPESVKRMNEARAKIAPKQKKTFRQKIVSTGASVVGAGYAVKDKYKMMKEKHKAGKTIRSYEKSAMKDLRELNKLQKEMRLLSKNGQTNSARYRDIQATIAELQGAGGNISRLRQQRANYAKRGIYFRGVGKTQRKINRMTYTNNIKGKVNQVKMTYRDATATFKQNKEAKRAVKEARELRQKTHLSASQEKRLKQLENFIEERSTVTSKLFSNRPGEKPKKVRMTSAQRMLNRDRNRISVQAAKEALSLRRDADKARAKGDRTLAEKYEKRASLLEKQVSEARKTSFRAYDPNASRRATRAQRILNRGSQKYAASKIREIRKKNPANLSEQEKRILDNSNAIRKSLRDNGVQLRRTPAQYMLNREINKTSVLAAKEALNLRRNADNARAKGDRALAEKYEKRASLLEKQVAESHKTSFRANNPNVSRRATRAQRILNRGSQKYAVSKIKEIRRKNPANLSEQEKRILDNSNAIRKSLRDNGVQLTKASKVEKVYNKPIIRMAKKEERAAYRTIIGTEIKTATQMIKDRKTTGAKGDYSAQKEERQRASEFLKRRGAVIKGPRVASKIESTIDRYDTWRDGANTRKKVRQNLKDTNRRAREALYGNTYNGVRGIRQEIKSAEEDLRSARAVMRKAGNDVAAMERAKQREEKAMKSLADARKREQLVYKNVKSAGADLRRHNIKIVSPVQTIRNARLEKKIEKDFMGSYEKARREEKVAERRANRVNDRIERREARETAIDTSINLVSDTKYDNKIRKMADRKAKKRAEAVANAATANNRVANIIREQQQKALERDAIRESHAREREITQSILREEKIYSHQGVVSRMAERTSDRFGKIASAPGRAIDFIKDAEVRVVETGAKAYSIAMSVPDEIRSVPNRVSEAISDAKAGMKNTFGRVQDSNNPTKTISLSEEIKRKARNKNLDQSRITINGIYTPPNDTSVPATPILSGSTHSKGAETVVFVRDNPSTQRVLTSEANVITLNTEKEVREAKKMAEEAKSTVGKGITNTIDEIKLEQLAYSVTALNQSDLGEYTASDVVSHIDNIRAIMLMMPQGTPEHAAMEKIVGKLKYNLDDYESNVRIQVLNDPSLVADNDPNKGKIMDSSIRHVKSLPSDEILLSMLRYEPGDLQEGYTPIARTAKAYQTAEQMAMQGIVTATEESTLQSTLEAAFRQKQRAEQIEAAEKGYEASKQAIKSDLFGIAKEAGGAALDMSVRMPLDLGVGMMAAGVAGGKTGDLLTVSAATATLGGYSIADKAYSSTSKFVTNRAKDVTSTVSTVKDKFAESLKPRNSNSGKGSGTSSSGPLTRNEAINLRKLALRDKTSVPKAGSGQTLSERLKKINGGS